MRISDWSSDVCSSDLAVERPEHRDEVLADRGLADPGDLDHGEFRWHGPSPHEDDGILVRTAARINPRDRGYPGRPRSPPSPLRAHAAPVRRRPAGSRRRYGSDAARAAG